MKPKICFVTSLPSSAKSFLKEPIKKLKNDFEVHYVGNYNDIAEVVDLGVDYSVSIPIERRPSLKKDIDALWKLYRHFRKEKYFAVHAITRKATLLTEIAAFAARVPHRIKTFTGQVWATMTGKRRKFYMLLDRIDVKLNTELLVDGESQRKFLIANGIMKDSDARVLAYGSICGVDTDRFKRSEVKRNEIRSKLSYLRDDIVFIFLGRLKKEKGIYELFEAFNQIVKTCPNARLLLVGNDEENCEDHIYKYDNLRKNDNVKFFGKTPVPEVLLQAGDIFVLPTYREGFGLAALEASSVGLPLICSDAYGVMDAMVDDVTGLRCKVKDVDSLRNSMINLYHNKNLREYLGRNGIERVHTKFNREIVTDAWLDFYKSLR